MGYKKASRKETIKINDRLKEIVINIGDDRCAYKDGFSDATVAREFNVGLHSVAGVRRELFGNLNKPKKSIGNKDKDKEELLRLTTNIISCYDDLKNRFNKLILTLSLNKVADCKHLEIK